VYYTPEYIVRKIVSNTVGQLIEGKAPAQIAALKFADISCGSGSFLLGVFDLLIRYHREWYNANPSKVKKEDCWQDEDGVYRLTLSKRRDILLNNIYGVDIDPQAVEVAQLSLYLKLLEEETTATAVGYQHMFHTALLPALGNNVVCGNSLIGTDVLEGELFAAEEERKLNPMNFPDRFPSIMRKGGFDAIVGNPPYIRIQGFPRNQVEYLVNHYSSATGNCDVYVSFVERGLSLLREGGRLGYIVPNKFFRTDYGVGLRTLLAKRQAVSEIIDFGAAQVFDATTYTCLLFLSEKRSRVFSYVKSAASQESLAATEAHAFAAASLSAEAWSFHDRAESELTKKLRSQSERLLDLPATMSRGSSTGLDEAYLIANEVEGIEHAILRRPLFASDFGRYLFQPKYPGRIIFPYEVTGNSATLIPESNLRRQFPRAYEPMST
jgi:adenine-specific DNA-methyltransferase